MSRTLYGSAAEIGCAPEIRASELSASKGSFETIALMLCFG
jgi:hypothetical protein